MAITATFAALKSFAEANAVDSKGILAMLLMVSHKTRSMTFPINPDDLLTQGGGQVAGASGKAGNRILRNHGVDHRLSEEGGRTSRGSIGKMRTLVNLLNTLHERGHLDHEDAERFWVERIKTFLATEPLKLKLDKSMSMKGYLDDLVIQAKRRQAQRPGSTIVGTVMQYMVAAKLRCMLNENAPKPHKSSEADSSRGLAGDFHISETVLHVTTSPGDSLIEKCRENLSKGLVPVIVTLPESVGHARALADALGIVSRMEFWSFDQFISTNLHEWGGFDISGVRSQAERLIGAYNDIISELHEEPSLRIEH